METTVSEKKKTAWFFLKTFNLAFKNDYLLMISRGTDNPTKQFCGTFWSPKKHDTLPIIN